jgi:hypothetical protein
VYWYIAGGVVVVIVAFLWWRVTSVQRGARQLDRKIFPLLDPIGAKLGAGEHPREGEINEVAQIPYARAYLHEMLKHFERLDLFPETFRSEEAQAEANLVYWMMHPNELQDSPEQIELIESVTRKIEGGICRFYVFRYKMPESHWAGNDWLLGLSGPFTDNEPPYSGSAGAFSRCKDKHGELDPCELVDWFVGMVGAKIEA